MIIFYWGKEMRKDKFADFIKKNFTLIMIGAAALACLLLLADTFKGNEQVDEKIVEPENTYAVTAKNELKSILEKIEGVGTCEIMITFEGGFENNYAQDISEEKTEYTVVGGETVLISKKTPEIAGVLVVCRGGDKSSVKNEVTDIVSRLFGIDKIKISVSKLR